MPFDPIRARGQVLMILRNAQADGATRLSGKEIAERFQATPEEISRVIGQLEQEGYLKDVSPIFHSMSRSDYVWIQGWSITIDGARTAAYYYENGYFPKTHLGPSVTHNTLNVNSPNNQISQGNVGPTNYEMTIGADASEFQIRLQEFLKEIQQIQDEHEREMFEFFSSQLAHAVQAGQAPQPILTRMFNMFSGTSSMITATAVTYSLFKAVAHSVDPAFAQRLPEIPTGIGNQHREFN